MYFHYKVQGERVTSRLAFGGLIFFTQQVRSSTITFSFCSKFMLGLQVMLKSVNNFVTSRHKCKPIYIGQF
jgi:hypothetical protein